MSKNKYNWKSSILSTNHLIKDVIKNLNQTNLQISLVAKKNKLIGTVTDGDIRRGLLKGYSLNEKVSRIMKKKSITVSKNTNYREVRELMRTKSILQIPIISNDKKILGLHFWNKKTSAKRKNNLVVIMAGGFGKRMRYKTSFTPKPMIILHGKPILEHIINNLKNSGFTNLIITTHYLEHKIIKFFGNGKNFGVNIEYIKEKKPLGTAGSLSKIYSNKSTPIIVTNGDVISNINYSEFLNYHNKNNAEASMAVREIRSKHSFGVVASQGLKIMNIVEKPITKTHINAGIYILNKKLIKLVKKNSFLSMTDLFNKIISKNYKAILFPLFESWQDFAKPKDLKVSKRKFKL
jgi:dTDP-glucose pyrophosphorylase/predicted transcriptional regulator